MGIFNDRNMLIVLQGTLPFGYYKTIFPCGAESVFLRGKLMQLFFVKFSVVLYPEILFIAIR